MKIRKLLRKLLPVFTAALLLCSCGGKTADARDPSTYIVINGKELPVPCSAEDMKNAGFTYKINDSYKDIANIYKDSAQTDENVICVLTSDKDEIDLSKSYDYLYVVGENCSFDYMGITEKTDMKQARKILGEPAHSSESDDIFNAGNSALTLYYSSSDENMTKNDIYISIGKTFPF